MKKMKLGTGNKIALAIVIVLALAIYYLFLPALNVQSVGFWAYALLLLIGIGASLTSFESKGSQVKCAWTPKYLWWAVLALLAIFLVGAISSTPLFFASKYASLITVEERSFTEDIPEEEEISNIALMDTESAQIIGARAVGSLADIVSQFEVSESYSTIDLNGQPMKVAPLEHAGFFKYMNNAASGIPGYVLVDPVGNEATYVKLEQAMLYSDSSYFFKNLRRHLRLQYPTYIFEDYYFELDNENNPWYVCPVLQSSVSLFGAKDVKGVVLLNPVDGSTEYYPVGQVPVWVDRVYDGDLLVKKYDWYGTLSGGFWNSVFGNVGCKMTTEDYGYKVMGQDVWVYTGVTSVNSDESNIGFVMMNSRTGESRYYQIPGAEEFSAMSAAEGQVQHLNYRASFPSLVNIGGQPTYLMTLKDNGGLVKLYAMVNVEKYNIVTTGTTQRETLTAYRKALKDNQISYNDTSVSENAKTAGITLKEIRYITMDGETWVYLTAEDGNVYKQNFADNETLIFLAVGDQIQVTYTEGEQGIRLMSSHKAE